MQFMKNTINIATIITKSIYIEKVFNITKGYLLKGVKLSSLSISL